MAGEGWRGPGCGLCVRDDTRDLGRPVGAPSRACGGPRLRAGLSMRGGGAGGGPGRTEGTAPTGKVQKH